ncbi:hypothetical protein V490_07006, partial [Pseudogymnoascus sp. VKM F-3557]
RRRRRRRYGRRESVDEAARDSSRGNFDEDEKQAPSTSTSKDGRRASNLRNERAFDFPFPFRRTPRRILPSRRLRTLPRPVSAKRLVSAVVLQGPRYLIMMVLVLLLVVVVRWYCEGFGCGSSLEAAKKGADAAPAPADSRALGAVRSSIGFVGYGKLREKRIDDMVWYISYTPATPFTAVAVAGDRASAGCAGSGPAPAASAVDPGCSQSLPRESTRRQGQAACYRRLVRSGGGAAVGWVAGGGVVHGENALQR